jgi:hypothetical protein
MIQGDGRWKEITKIILVGYFLYEHSPLQGPSLVKVDMDPLSLFLDSFPSCDLF